MESQQAASFAPIPARHGRGLEQARKIGRLLRGPEVLAVIL